MSDALSLLVISPGGTSTVAVPERGTLVLGRARDCDVVIDDAKLSRRHAELRCGEVIELVDLGSLNGCHVRDARVKPNEPARVRVGDAMSMGSTVLVLQRAAHPAQQPARVWTHGYFEARLEEECARAEAPFAIVRIQIAPLGSGSAATASATDGAAPALLFAWLRGADIVATYAPHDYEVLLTKTSPDDAEERAADLARSLGRAKVPHGIAVAAYPRDGRTSEALIEHASRALRRGAAPAGATLPPLGALERLEKVIARIAEGEINVLILGETGAGKEVLARRIHALSPRAKMPMVSLNCAALSEALVESELFGHEKGAFTGAQQSKPGLLETASGGVVFLDEIGEMPLGLQAKLLRVIEQREVLRVGSLRPRPIDVRFLAATNRDLEEEIAHGRFRQDLFFRLNGIALSLPPLRERADEIEPLATAFVEAACRSMNRARSPRIALEAMETLRRYRWPGNIRELRNMMERAVLLCSGEVITREHLPIEKMEAQTATARVTEPPAAVGEGDAEAEKKRIMDALDACVGNQSRAAEMLGMSRATLIRRLVEHRLPRPRKR